VARKCFTVIDGQALYHYGLDSIVPAQGSDSLPKFGIRAGDLLFAVSERWPRLVCRWLAEEALDALLSGPDRQEGRDREQRHIDRKKAAAASESTGVRGPGS
jgi:hypothetical protein